MNGVEIAEFADVHAVIAYVKTFGVMAPLVAFGLFVVQAALPVFPYIILAAAGGLLFGFKMGFLLSWSGALAGATLAYWVCRLLAAEWAERKIKQRFGYDISRTDGWMAFWSIVVARIVPVIPTPAINAAAAVGGVSFWNFFFSSAIGKIPSAVLYTGLGLALYKTQDIKLALIILGAVLTLAIIGRYYAKDRFFKTTSRHQ